MHKCKSLQERKGGNREGGSPVQSFNFRVEVKQVHFLQVEKSKGIDSMKSNNISIFKHKKPI